MDKIGASLGMRKSMKNRTYFNWKNNNLKKGGGRRKLIDFVGFLKEEDKKNGSPF